MKTLQQIKDEVVQEYSYKSWKDFKDLTRRIDTDQVFVMDGMVNLVAKRYAAEVGRGLAKCITRVVTPGGEHIEWLVDIEKCDKFLKDNNLLNELK